MHATAHSLCALNKCPALCPELPYVTLMLLHRSSALLSLHQGRVPHTKLLVQCADYVIDCLLLQAEYMQLVKEAFMEKDAMAVIVGLVAEPLSRHPRMTEADGLIVQLIITFMRNLLAVPDRAATAGVLFIQTFLVQAHYRQSVCNPCTGMLQAVAADAEHLVPC